MLDVTCLYIMTWEREGLEPAVKIGISEVPYFRLADLNTQLAPFGPQIEVESCTAAMREGRWVERILHKMFEPRRAGEYPGIEWFYVSPAEVKTTYNELARLRALHYSYGRRECSPFLCRSWNEPPCSCAECVRPRTLEESKDLARKNGFPL
jgi:hypothetical protein